MQKMADPKPPVPYVPTFRERNPITTTALHALAVGGGVSALSAIVADIIEAKRQRDESKKRKKKTVSPDTVVFHIKNKDDQEKLAQSCEGSCECNPAECDGEKIVGEECNVVPKVESTLEDREIAYQGADSQPRTKDGKFSTLGKVANQKGHQNRVTFGDIGRALSGGSGNVDYTWNETPGAALQIAAAPVAAIGGWYAVKALHKKLEENRLKKQVEAAQKEYVDLLEGKNVKNAEAFKTIFLFDDDRFFKTAQQGQASGQNYNAVERAAAWVGRQMDNAAEPAKAFNDGAKAFTAGTLASLLLTTGAGAWLTHKVLASKFDKKDEEEEPRKVTKVMFKESEAIEKEIVEKFPKLMFKSASGEFEITPEQFLCTIEVLRGCIRGDAMIKTAQAVSPEQIQKYRAFEELARRVNDKLPIGFPKVTAPELAVAISSDKPSFTQRTIRGVAESLIGANNSWLGKAWGTMNGGWQKAPSMDEIRQGINEFSTGPNGEKLDPAARMRQAGYYIRGQETGMNDDLWQHAMRRYAEREAGLPYNPTVEGLDEMLGGAVGQMDEGAVSKAVTDRMAQDPDSWFRILGSKDMSDVREALIAKYFRDTENQPGFLGGLYKIPILGDLIKSIQGGFLNNTRWGRRIMARRALMGRGMTAEQADAYMKDWDFGNGYNGWRKIPQNQDQAQTPPGTGAPGSGAPVAPGAGAAAPGPGAAAPVDPAAAAAGAAAAGAPAGTPADAAAGAVAPAGPVQTGQTPQIDPATAKQNFGA